VYSALSTEVKIIKSTINREQTARKLGLLSDGMPEDKKQAVLGQLQGKISAERVGDTNLITISAMSSDAEETANVANAAAEVYIQKARTTQRHARDLRSCRGSARGRRTKAQVRGRNELAELHRGGAKGVGGTVETSSSTCRTSANEPLKK